MFSWYGKSDVCYAYLDDVEGSNAPSVHNAFRRSEWFMRGWTLQELIAPKQIVFLQKDWAEIGTRNSLVDTIQMITRVDRNVLLGLKLPVEFGVAERMSWASERNTTRVEDMAYCLMGLFGIHMPTIYGEGKQAFIRLQHEIMRSTPDHSIFAWGWSNDNDSEDVLAPEPSRFRYMVRPMSYKHFAQLFRIDSYLPEYTMANHGIRIRLPMQQKLLPNGECQYTVALACQNGHEMFGLRLQSVEGTTDQYCRVGLAQICTLDPEPFTMKDLYLAHHSHSRAFDIGPDLSITLLPADAPYHYASPQVYPPRRWEVTPSGKLSMTIANGRAGSYCSVFVLQQENGQRIESIAVVLGVHHNEYHKLHRMTASLFIDDDGKGTWSTLPPRPQVVLCTSSFNKEAAKLIWQKYQNERFDHWYLVNDFVTPRKQFDQISLERGSRVTHLTTITYVRAGTNERILEARIVNQANPYLAGWNLVWFLGSILQHTPTSDLKTTVLMNIASLVGRGGIASYFARMFLYDEAVWRVRDVPEAMDFMGRSEAELWRIYYEKVRVHIIHSDNVDGDGDIPVYRYGNVEVREDDFLGVAAHFKAAIASALTKRAPPPITSVVDDYCAQ